ncbi:Eco57I restriction-modification methylase domain-containing protein [Haloarcula pelagica]|uniref:Eco57I restriction-modification methylase domain-containing protein n=1 Tax=Haloarcula pelagica TaxID=3033389 RepID=UPI0024C299E9|nr:N-6 DNA methylase [Halomicroarcula sp. YJ-61-S]
MSQATLSSTPYRNSSLFSGYYLDERIDDLEEWECNAEATEAFEDLQELWELEGDLLPGYKEDELLSSWIDEVLDILGFGRQSETTVPGGKGYNDRLLFDSDETRREAAKRALDGNDDAMYGMASAVLEAKQWGADFTKKFDEHRSYRDASHQIKYYLEKTPERLQWGILTDGKKWRLYGTKDYATEIYYEVDLPELLASGDLERFKYFYAFFRPAAFRETGGTTFLDTVWNESETAAQELGEDLQDNVFTALRVLGEGFIETNDLDIDPEDEAARAELKEQSLVLLYRLMFVLYAESRGLIHPDDPEAQDEYEELFSLDELRAEIHEDITSGDIYEDYSDRSTQFWARLENLFELVDEGDEELGIPPYNGGLFDEESNQFLAENEVSNRYIAEVIHRLGTTEGDDEDPVLADYADLDTRHLGSIYEGLLEHEFRIASEPYAAVAEDGGQVWKPATEVSVADAVEDVEKGELYVVNDDGERKATGAYYTPDYVVSYIVEETIDPLLDDIRAELEADGLEPSDQGYFGRFYRQVQELKILDPAMGSAHFLTSATAYLTEQVMEVVREQEEQGRDEQEIRRTIAKECIYGVDVNGMAVELGKLSMWLETLAADKPLAFLDHHLKAGNSLVGSDISEVLSDENNLEGQITLTQVFAQARQQTLEHVMELMEDLLAIDNENYEDIKSMEAIYDKIRDDPLYKRLFEIANVHTAEEFGLDVPEGVYEEMAGAIEDGEEWAEIQEEDWFKSAQATAEEVDFFHWELEFPEVFFGSGGERLEGAGFDAVAGNPPYAKIPGEVADCINPDVTNDLYSQFIVRAGDFTREGGYLSFIAPTSWETGPDYDSVRDFLLSDGALQTLVNLPYDVFEDAYVDTGIFVWQKGREGDECDIANLSGTRLDPEVAVANLELTGVPVKQWQEIGFIALSRDFISLYNRIGGQDTLGEHTESTRGVLVTDEAIESETADTPICTNSYSRYETIGANDSADWELLDECPPSKEVFEGSRLLVRRLVSRDDRLLGTYSSEFFVSKKDVYIFTSEEFSEKFLLTILNSTLLSWWHFNVELSASKDDFRQVTLTGLRELPFPNIRQSDARSEVSESSVRQCISGELDIDSILTTLAIEGGADSAARATMENLADEMLRLQNKLSNLNLSLRDHFGSYSDGPTLADIGLTQPPKGSADTVLQQTVEERPNLKVGEAVVNRESDTTVEIRLTARYKPDPSKKGKDAYTETEPLPALRITDLSETEADLIEAFVPVAVDKAGGFGEFRETATITYSLVDRLRQLTLPAVDEVRDGLESYIETKERADELEGKIERTDELIDEIVYELYGLTEEEIEIVEEAVGE